MEVHFEQVVYKWVWPQEEGALHTQLLVVGGGQGVGFLVGERVMGQQLFPQQVRARQEGEMEQILMEVERGWRLDWLSQLSRGSVGCGLTSEQLKKRTICFCIICLEFQKPNLTYFFFSNWIYNNL